MKLAAPKPDKREVFEAAVRDGEGAAAGEATTARRRAPAKAASARAAGEDAPGADAEQTAGA
jgi:small subunit ribosomal protein S16